MRSVETSGAGWDSFQNKTLPRKQERNEASCVAETRVVAVPVVVEIVPVQHNLVAVLVEIRDIEVAVAVLHEMYGISPSSTAL